MRLWRTLSDMNGISAEMATSLSVPHEALTWPRVPDFGDDLDLLAAVGRAARAGHDVMLMRRRTAAEVTIAGIGRRYELLHHPQYGVVIRDTTGQPVDAEPDTGGPLAAAGRLWRRFTHTEPGLGAVALGGFAFDPRRRVEGDWRGFPGVLFRVPELILVRTEYGLAFHGDLSLVERPCEPCPRCDDIKVAAVRPEPDWLAAVEQAIRRLGDGEARKVVLAREMRVEANGPIPPEEVTRVLQQVHPTCYTYLLTGRDGAAMVGASPELLLRRTGPEVVSQPMAGTTARGPNPDEDERLAARLMESVKDAREHQVTVRHVADCLADSGARVRVGAPEVVKLDNVQHLATTIKGDLEGEESLLETVARLHPTPAVNGEPVDAARRMISELEGFDRGWYTGAVGWIGGHGDGELAVAIRCGLFAGSSARLYAGNGVMPDSEPATELAETKIKLAALTRALRS